MRRLMLLLLCLSGCGDDDDGAAEVVDAAASAADAREIDPAPYYQNCIGADDCPQPYQCTEVNDFGPIGPRDVCLVPCASNDECGVGCCCRANGCGSDVGKDGFCSC